MFNSTSSLALICLTGFFLFGCNKETVESPKNTSFDYFPVSDGKWVEYVVDSTYHAENDNNNDDSVYSYHFEIREEIDSSFIDGEGRSNQIIKRFRRNSSADPWTLSDVWTQRLSINGAFKTEENIIFHKLTFPFSSTVSWNGNDANTLDEEFYSYEYFHEPAVINSLSFDSIVSVLQIDENNFVERLYGNEKYAAGVGLVFKQRDELGKRNGIVVKGLEYRMQVSAFGN